jgi:hypothetical protein
MKLKQTDFERRGFLEMLEFASDQLQKHIYFRYRKHYRYMFTANGRPIKSLREITPDMHLLVVSDKAQFQGLFNSQKIVTNDAYQSAQKLKVTNERMQSIQKWYSNRIQQNLPLKQRKHDGEQDKRKAET